MKKSIIAVALSAALLLSGCSNVSQEDYNSVVAENSQLKAENSSLQTENRDLSISSKVSEDLLKEYGDKIYDLESQLSEKSGDNVSVAENKDDNNSAKKDIPLYEDDFVKINYVGFGRKTGYPFSGRQAVILTLENKTDTTFNVASVNLAFDGVSEQDLTAYEKIPPKSKGDIYIIKMNDTNPNFSVSSPQKITGSFSIGDKDDVGVFGEHEWWHKISFIDVEI